MQATVTYVLALILVTGSAYSIWNTQQVAAQTLESDAVKESGGLCKETGTSDNYLYSFSCGNSQTLSNGTTVRNFTLVTEETHQIPISSDYSNDMNDPENEILFPGWTYNGTIPGPTMRMTEGDHVFITVKNSEDSEQPHSLHMHSIHSPMMDGTVGEAGAIAPGDSFTYSFVAGPVGLYPYHCHVAPIVDHVNRGLYGAMIIDPKEGRAPANEMVMMMNSYDLDLNEELAPTFRIPTAEEGMQILYPDKDLTPEEQEEARPELETDRGNEVYTVNGKAFEYMHHPVQVKAGEPVRIYLLSMTEFDPVNNLHLHAGMFNYTASGTEGTAPIVTDIVTLGQGDRGIIEFTPQQKGKMMFHSHVNEFAELGWMSFFEVV